LPYDKKKVDGRAVAVDDTNSLSARWHLHHL